MARIAALIGICSLTAFAMSCSQPKTDSPTATSEANRPSPATASAGLAGLQQFDTRAEAERVLTFRVPEPTRGYARIGRFVVRGTLTSETKYRLPGGSVATVVVRNGASQTPISGDRMTVGGVQGVVAGDRWSFRFVLHLPTGDLDCLVYAPADVDDHEFAEFVTSLEVR